MPAPSPAAQPESTDPTPSISQPQSTSPAPPVRGHGIPRLALCVRDGDAAGNWKPLRDLIPHSVRALIPVGKLEKLPEGIAKGWDQRCALIDSLPLPSLHGLDWLMPSLPLQEWHDRYLSLLRHREWTSAPADPSQDWRIPALAVRQVEDLVVPPASPLHDDLVVSPSPQTWIAWTPPQNQDSQPQPFLLLTASPETLMQSEIRRVMHLQSGLTVSLTVGSACLLVDQDDQEHLCRLFQHQGRVFTEAESPTTTPS